jgi:hypothetical protein
MLRVIPVSSGGVRGVWQRHSLLTKHDRLLRLEKATAERQLAPSQEPIKLLERFSPEYRGRDIKPSSVRNSRGRAQLGGGSGAIAAQRTEQRNRLLSPSLDRRPLIRGAGAGVGVDEIPDGHRWDSSPKIRFAPTPRWRG